MWRILCEIWKEREMDDYSSKGWKKAKGIRLSQLSELAMNFCNLHLKFDVLTCMETISSEESAHQLTRTQRSSLFDRCDRSNPDAGLDLNLLQENDYPRQKVPSSPVTRNRLTGRFVRYASDFISCRREHRRHETQL